MITGTTGTGKILLIFVPKNHCDQKPNSITGTADKIDSNFYNENDQMLELFYCDQRGGLVRKIIEKITTNQMIPCIFLIRFQSGSTRFQNISDIFKIGFLDRIKISQISGTTGTFAIIYMIFGKTCKNLTVLSIMDRIINHTDQKVFFQNQSKNTGTTGTANFSKTSWKTLELLEP